MFTEVNYGKIMESFNKESLMAIISIVEATKLFGIKDWVLTDSQERLLIHFKNDMLERFGKEWIINNRDKFQDELMVILQTLGPITKKEKEIEHIND